MTTSTIQWNITDLQRKISDGFVFAAFYEVAATAGPHRVSILRSASFERAPGDLIPYESLTPEIIIRWCKNHADVSALEAQVQTELDTLLAAETVSGLPWMSYDSAVS
jgi:hypothetical protein